MAGTTEHARNVTTAEAIADEIRQLRSRRGLQGADLDRRAGCYLKELGTGPSGEFDRRLLIDEITRCADRLPADLRLNILASLAIYQETVEKPLLTDRIAWLAEKAHIAPRTILRRFDEAEKLLAAEIARELANRRRRSPLAPSGWYVDELSTVLRLDKPNPEAHERRRIVSARDGLSEVKAWHDVPNAEGSGRAVEGDVAYGGRLLRTEGPVKSCYQFLVGLPRPLAAGETHEYELVLKVRDGHVMRPHYILVPEYTFNRFILRVRFDLNRLPLWVRKVEGERIRDFDVADPGTESLIPDEAGEVALEFSKPAMHLGHGLQWQLQ